jgi:hypothetical protein
MQTLRRTSRLIRCSGFGWLTLVCAAFAATLTTASIAAPDGPPKLNVGPSCDAAARVAIVSGRNKEACMGDEHAAQDEIAKKWSKYAYVDKTQCVGMNRTGGASSYVELLSCLEIMTDAKIIFKNDALLDAEHHKFELNTRARDEDNLFTVDRTTAHGGHKRNHQE